jgi:hypothetical protein
MDKTKRKEKNFIRLPFLSLSLICQILMGMQILVGLATWSRGPFSIPAVLFVAKLLVGMGPIDPSFAPPLWMDISG